MRFRASPSPIPLRSLVYARRLATTLFVICAFFAPEVRGFSGVDVSDFRPHTDRKVGAQALRATLAEMLLKDSSVKALAVAARVQLLDLATKQVEALTDRGAAFAQALEAHLDDVKLVRDDIDEFLKDLEEAKQADVAAASTAPFLVPAFEFSDSDKNILSQLRPGVSLGVPRDLGRNLRLLGTLRLAAPVAADSASDYAEVLVSPGTFNINVAIDYRLAFFGRRLGSLRLIPFGVVKLRPGLADSTSDGSDVVFVQHGLGVAAVFQYADALLLSAHHVWGWHNLTTASEQHFASRFPSRSITDVRYWNVGAQINTGRIGGQMTSFYLEWRKLVDEDGFAGFGDTKTLSFGFRNKIRFDL